MRIATLHLFDRLSEELTQVIATSYISALRLLSKPVLHHNGPALVKRRGTKHNAASISAQLQLEKAHERCQTIGHSGSSSVSGNSQLPWDWSGRSAYRYLPSSLCGVSYIVIHASSSAIAFHGCEFLGAWNGRGAEHAGRAICAQAAISWHLRRKIFLVPPRKVMNVLGSPWLVHYQERSQFEGFSTHTNGRLGDENVLEFSILLQML